MAGTEDTIAKGIAAGRVLFGLGCLVAPRTVLGPTAARAEGQMIWMARAFGVRDIVLGTGTLLALGQAEATGAEGADEAATRWVELSAAADSLDIANAVVFHGELDRGGVAATLALAVPAAVGRRWAARTRRATA